MSVPFTTQRFTAPLEQTATIIDQYGNARASGKRVTGLMDMPTTIEDDPDAIDLERPVGRGGYGDVSVRYETDGERILEGTDFEAEPGETVALVGPTGAGKSTVLRLLTRMYDVESGAVRVDGHDVRDLALSSLRESIGYVGQGNYLFGGTVEENVAYGSFDADGEAIVAAAKAAQAHGFITGLREGYDTQVGEEGVKLAGGQRQRIALARVILSDPEILIFDEATSDVDTETEVLIQRSLDELTEDRTTFIIAHRLSTVKHADTIPVLEDGEIVERGGYEELLAEDGLYANRRKVQAGGSTNFRRRSSSDSHERTERYPRRRRLRRSGRVRTERPGRDNADETRVATRKKRAVTQADEFPSVSVGYRRRAIDLPTSGLNPFETEEHDDVRSVAADCEREGRSLLLTCVLDR